MVTPPTGSFVKRGIATAATFIAALALPPVAGATDAAERVIRGPAVRVADDFYDPATLTVKKNTKVKFRWAPENVNPHNVNLAKGPTGVRKRDFRSATDETDVKFAPIFEKRGTYNLLCTIHPDVMKMKVTVKR